MIPNYLIVNIEQDEAKVKHKFKSLFAIQRYYLNSKE